MTTTFYDLWREAPERVWRWKNFSPAGIACRGTAKLLATEAAIDRLETLRDRIRWICVRPGHLGDCS